MLHGAGCMGQGICQVNFFYALHQLGVMNEILHKKVSPPFEANPCTHLLNVSHYLLFTPCPLKGVLAL
jgi:hypothetical protein